MPLNPYGDQPQNQHRRTQSKASDIDWLLFLSVLVFMWFAFFPEKEQEFDFVDDDPVVVVDDEEDNSVVDPDVNKVAFDKSYLVRVYHTEADKYPMWMNQFINNHDDFWVNWLVEEKKSRLFTYDPDNSQSDTFISAAEKNGVKVPFFLFATSGGKTLDVIPFEESLTVEDLKQKLLAKAE